MSLPRRSVLAALLVLFAALAGVWLLLLRDGRDGPPSVAKAVAARRAALGECLRERAKEANRSGGEREREAGGHERECAGAPESTEDLAKINSSVVARLGNSDARTQLARALRQRDRLAARAAAAGVPGTGGTWQPYGKGPLRFDDPNYPASYGDGFGRVNGRVNDLLYVPQTKRLYAAVAQGGVWASPDLGKTWKPIGETLPIGSTGAVGWTPADGGTLIAATGDHAFSNDYAGVGVYWTSDEGVTWVKARGVPDGGLSYRVAVDPTDPRVVYVATGLGLYRSTDAGHSFTNVQLPTGRCAGDSLKPSCFFANIVTDVAVQPADKFGHKGGAVLAIVGWRAGNRTNLSGKQESPNNGVYRSDTGQPGTFSKIDKTGYPTSDVAGRGELGVATGAGQNADYVYAMVQDAAAFNGSTTGGEDDIPLVGTPSVLEGLYVSKDFGKNWTRLASREDFYNPANGSSLSPLVPAGIGPGYQVTYNQWIKPDPTRTDAGGIPTRLLFGMEEVWSSTDNNPQDGSSQQSYRAFGQYTANGGACLVIPDQCGAKQQVTPTNTTTHPDQHGNAMIPDGKGGLTLAVSNDGGVYTQHADSGQEFDQSRWGLGANEGFYTLLPYGVAVAKDGTAYAGLQDNGQLKIDPDGTQRSVYVGDGTFALVDPNNSKVNYDELPLAGVNVSTDGGVTYRSIDPELTSPDFVAPMVMDPGDANHLMVVGREVKETTLGPDTTPTCKELVTSRTECNPQPDQSKTWKTAYDLGTAEHRGDANATAADGDPDNHGSAAQVIGDDAYVGFCGGCDPVKLKQRFANGLATNVGGSKAPKRTTSDGWHIAGAKGLPDRLITSVTMDPADHRTLYVTLGNSATRYFAPLGSEGEDASDAAGGFVYKSTDAGETFKDITGALPKTQATWSVVRDGQLIVADAVGIFAARDTNGTDWVPLGEGLPPTATYSMALKPGDSNTLVAATFGRGVYRYTFAAPHAASQPGPGCRDRTAPTSKFKKTARTAGVRRKLKLSGTSSDRGCGKSFRGTVRRIRVSIARRTGNKCRSLLANGKLSRKRTSCRRTTYVSGKGTTKWSLTLKRRLPKGQYQIWVRGIDAAGNVEKKSRKRNFKRLRLR
jgi:hypothetical protein